MTTPRALLGWVAQEGLECCDERVESGFDPRQLLRERFLLLIVHVLGTLAVYADAKLSSPGCADQQEPIRLAGGVGTVVALKQPRATVDL